MSALVVLLSPLLWLWFRRLQATDRDVRVVAVIWALLLVEMALYPNQSTVPPGPFNPDLGGFSLRLVDIVVLAALTARLSLGGQPCLRTAGLLWIGLLAWLLTAVLIGLLNGNPFDQLSFESRIIVYLAAIALTAGIPVREYLDRPHLTYLIAGAAALAALLLVTDTASLSVDLGAQPPEGAEVLLDDSEPIDPAGELSADAATIFVALGVLAIALAISTENPQRRIGLMIAAAPLFASTLGPTQRAAFLGLAVSLIALAALALFSSRKLQSRPTEWGLALLAVAAFVVGPAVLESVSGERAAELPFQAQVTTGLTGGEERLTTLDRVNQLREARTLIEERPVFGWGLGKTYSYFSPGLSARVETDVTHNIGTDLLLRSGVVGFALFAAAIAATLFGGVRSWFVEHRALVAALSLGLVAAIMGILAKGMAESIFEKYRIALALALLIGMLLSSSVSAEPEQRRVHTDP